MTDTLLKELEESVGSDDFEFRMEEIMEKLSEEGAGFEIVESLLGIMERHPLEDFGMPGAMVNFIESFDPEYIPLLTASIKRSPSAHTVFMLNRCINGDEHKDEYIKLLESVAENDSIDDYIRESAQEFLDFQK